MKGIMSKLLKGLIILVPICIVLIIGINMKNNISRKEHYKLQIDGGKGYTEIVDLDLNTIANSQYNNTVSLLAIEKIVMDKDIDKKVDEQVKSIMKANGEEKEFKKYLSDLKVSKEQFMCQLKYNILCNEAMDKIVVPEITEDNISKEMIASSSSIPRKYIKYYQANDVKDLLPLETKLKNLDSSTKYVSSTLSNNVKDMCEVISEDNVLLWNVTKSKNDGNCTELIKNNNTNYLIYNISTLSEEEQRKEFKQLLVRKKKSLELDKKIKAEKELLKYKLK